MPPAVLVVHLQLVDVQNIPEDFSRKSREKFSSIVANRERDRLRTARASVMLVECMKPFLELSVQRLT
jgi:hypothetical protein